MARFEANTVKGLILALDRRKVTPPQVLDGRNFFVDVDGPRSGFSRSEMMHGLIEDPYFAEAFKTDADVDSWIFTRSAVVKFDWETGTFIPVFTYARAAVEFPWSTALVGGKHYFAKRGVGLIQYDPITDSWMNVTGGSVPVDIVGCCEAGGRLVVEATGIVAWSVIDDGTDFTPSTATGAGFQTLSLVGSFTLDSLLGVYRTADGFIAYTKNGLMKGEVVTSLSPFRFRKLAFTHVPCNPFCITFIDDDQHVFLTRLGFYTTKGAVPEIWQPLMGEYLRTAVIPHIADTVDGVARVKYFPASQWFFVSISDSLTASLYSRAFVYSPRSDEWGSFNKLHTSMMEVWISDGPHKGLNFGYMDSNGNAYKFTYDAVDLLFPELTWYNEVYSPPPQFPARIEFGVASMPSVGHIVSFNESIFPAPGVFNLYDEKEDADSPELDTLGVETPAASESGGVTSFPSYFDSAAGMIQLYLQYEPYAQSGLDSFVEVGLFRLMTQEGGEDVSELSYITDVTVGMLGTATVGTIYEDYVADYSADIFEDWLSATGFEDWGQSSAAGNTFTADIKSSFGGFDVMNDQEEELELVFESGKNSQYSCYSTGVYHSVFIRATEPGESFHLKALELSGNSAGRIL